MAEVTYTQECLAEIFRDQARWRQTKAEEYPDDYRNAQSASALNSLANYVLECDPTEVEDAHDFLFNGVHFAGEQTGHAVSRYGFGYNALTDSQHSEFIKELIQVVAMRDAFDSVREIGSDSWAWELLTPAERDAAIADVSLPDRYFEARARSTEEAIEAAIASYMDEG
jgi:hypothetical protein